MSRKTVSVVVPVYHNEESLPQLFDELAGLEEALVNRDLDLELIFVDDGSGDGSFDELLKIKARRPQTKLIKLTRNFGSIAASRTGFRYITGDCFTILAADLQDPVSDVLRMVDSWRDGKKFTICVRSSREDPVMTRLFARIYYSIVRCLIISDYPVGGFDLMLLDKQMLPAMRDVGQRTHPNLYAYWMGYRPEVLTYTRQRRRHGQSRWTFKKKLRLFVDTITGFSVTPVRILSRFGMVVALLSFLYGIYIGVNGILGNIDVRGFSTLVVLITFFSGLILVMLGAVGEYLWRIFDAMQNRPEAVIDESHL